MLSAFFAWLLRQLCDVSWVSKYVYCLCNTDSVYSS